MHEMLGVAHKYIMYYADCYEYALVKDGIFIAVYICA